jgi:hypothetical protein
VVQQQQSSGLAADSSVKTAGVCGQPWQNLVANVGQAHIGGVNVDVEYALTEKLNFRYELRKNGSTD